MRQGAPRGGGRGPQPNQYPPQNQGYYQPPPQYNEPPQSYNQGYFPPPDMGYNSFQEPAFDPYSNRGGPPRGGFNRGGYVRGGFRGRGQQDMGPSNLRGVGRSDRSRSDRRRSPNKEAQYRDVSLLNKEELLKSLKEGNVPSYSILNEYCKKAKKQIDYQFSSSERNKNNNAIFDCIVKLDNKDLGKGHGTNKKDSRENAALHTFELLFNEDNFVIQFVDHWLNNISNKTSKSIPLVDVNQVNFAEELATIDLNQFQPANNYREQLSDFCQQVLKCQFRFVMDKKGIENVAYVHIGDDCEMAVGKCVKSARNLACYKMLCKFASRGKVDPLHKEFQEKMSQQKKEGIGRETLPAPRLDQIKQNANMVVNTQVNALNVPVNNPQLDMNYEYLNNDNFTIIYKPMDEDDKLIEYFRSLDTKLTASVDEYKLINEILEEFFVFQEVITKLGFHSVFPVGLYNMRALQKTNVTCELSANYKVQKLEQFDFKIIAQNFKAVFEKLLKQSQAVMEQGVSVMKSRIQVDEAAKTIRLKHPNPNLKISVLLVVEPIVEKYSDYIHHYIWIQELIKANVPKNQQMHDDIVGFFRLIRFFHEQNKVKVPVEILDFIYYVISNGFKIPKISRNIVQFFKFIAQNGLQDLKFEKKNICKIDKLHDRMYQKVDQSHITELENLCKEIYYNQKYEDVFQNLISKLPQNTFR